MNKKTLWESYSPERKTALTSFCEDYRKHLSRCKTERECVVDMVERAKRYGYKAVSYTHLTLEKYHCAQNPGFFA